LPLGLSAAYWLRYYRTCSAIEMSIHGSVISRKQKPEPKPHKMTEQNILTILGYLCGAWTVSLIFISVWLGRETEKVRRRRHELAIDKGHWERELDRRTRERL